MNSRQRARADFTETLQGTGWIAPPALTICVLAAAADRSLTTAKLGAYVRGLVAAYVELDDEREAEPPDALDTSPGIYPEHP